MSAGETKLKALLIEDNEADARLLEELLKDDPAARLELEWVKSLDEGVRRLLDGDFDVVLLDLSLPDSSKDESVSTMHLFDSSTPIVVLSGDADEEASIKAIREGAQDYLVKGQVTVDQLVRTVRLAIERRRAAAVRERPTW